MRAFAEYYKLPNAPNDRKRDRRWWVHLSDGLTFAVLGVFTFNAIFITLQLWSVLSPTNTPWLSCSVMELILNATYQLCKLLIYLIFITRLELAFFGTEYAYDRRWILFLYGACILYYVISVYLQIITIESHWMYSPDTWCTIFFPEWLIAIIMIFDVLISLITLVMFIRPFRILLSKIDGFIKDNGFHHLMSKYIILSMITILSTLIGFLATWFGFAILLGIDDLVNVTCVVLLTTIHDRDYRWLCNCWYQAGCCCGACCGLCDGIANSLPRHDSQSINGHEHHMALVTNTNDHDNGHEIRSGPDGSGPGGSGAGGSANNNHNNYNNSKHNNSGIGIMSSNTKGYQAPFLNKPNAKGSKNYSEEEETELTEFSQTFMTEETQRKIFKDTIA